jgi:hypothetical protein
VSFHKRVAKAGLLKALVPHLNVPIRDPIKRRV